MFSITYSKTYINKVTIVVIIFVGKHLEGSIYIHKVYVILIAGASHVVWNLNTFLFHKVNLSVKENEREA
jgi:hypothetical protein